MDIVNPTLVAALTPLAGAVPAPPSVGPAAAPDASSAAFFAQLMSAPQPVPAIVQAAPVVPSVSASAVGPSSSAAQSMGDQILAGMQSVSTELKTSWNSISSTLESTDTLSSTAGLLKAQLEIAQLSLQFQFIGSATTWVTDGINQLVKMQ
jgi:hypothetical protein